MLTYIWSFGDGSSNHSAQNPSHQYTAYGTYTVTLTATDNQLDVSIASIVLYINDVPTINHQGLNSVIQSASGSNITWTITDVVNNNTSYIIYVNGTAVANGTWTSGIPISHIFDTTQPGTYNITIVVIDGYGGQVNDTFWLTVTPTTSTTSTISTNVANFQMALSIITVIAILGTWVILGIPLILAVIPKGKHFFIKPMFNFFLARQTLICQKLSLYLYDTDSLYR